MKTVSGAEIEIGEADLEVFRSLQDIVGDYHDLLDDLDADESRIACFRAEELGIAFSNLEKHFGQRKELPLIPLTKSCVENCKEVPDYEQNCGKGLFYFIGADTKNNQITIATTGISNSPFEICLNEIVVNFDGIE